MSLNISCMAIPNTLTSFLNAVYSNFSVTSDMQWQNIIVPFI